MGGPEQGRIWDQRTTCHHGLRALPREVFALTGGNIDRPGPEDAGAETLARFEFQICLTALECVRLLSDPDALEIVCEWWEDYVILRASGMELVSVKHREPSQGPWSLATLVEAGGLKHVFERWKDSGRSARCRLSTNAGLRSGALEAAAVQRAAEGGGDSGVVDVLVERLAAVSREEVESFLESLVIEAELPKRDDLVPKLLVDVLPPLCASLGWPPETINERFAAIRDAVGRAASSDLRSDGRSLQVPARDVARARARKTLNREKLNAALSRSPVHASRMVRKLDAGGFGPTDVQRCIRLRAQWLELEYSLDPGLPGPFAAQDLREMVQDLAVAAEAAAARTDDTYGAKMRDALQQSFAAVDFSFAGAQLNLDLLLGVAYDETDRCNIWWSARTAVAGS